MSRRESRCIGAVSVVTPVVCALTLGSCGLLTGSDEFLAQVDSVRVEVPLPNSSAIPLTFFGYVGANGCVDLQRVERHLVADTITWRFVSRSRNGDCIQMPIPLRYVDSIPSQPTRTVHVRVDQRGTPLRRTLSLPLSGIP